jgi:acetylornithine deacetylase/succinyl-diaminopimelate desuccinylase family protein
MTIEAVLQQIIHDEIIRLASELVKIPSYSGLPDQEKAVAEYITAYFHSQQISVRSQEVMPGRPNVIAVLPGKGSGPSLMLSGHMDTVPPYHMTENPFSGAIHRNRLHGRGAADMKGALAAMMAAMTAIRRSGIQLTGDLVFAGVVNEEQLNEGTEYIVRHGPLTDAAIIGEPTELKIAAGHRGLEWIEVIVHGKATHGGTPTEGINAISKAARLIRRIEEELVPTFARNAHPLVGEPLLNFGVIEGGDQPSSVAGRCRICIDRRWTPLETFEGIYHELEDLIREMEREDPQFKATVGRFFRDSKMMLHRPLVTDLQHPVIKSLEQSIRQAGAGQTEIISFPAWTDASLLSNYAHVTSVVCGPGHLKDAHSENESISLDQIIKAFEVYTRTAMLYCGQENGHD